MRNIEGNMSELFIIYQLNELNIECPECKHTRCFATCNQASFKDCVCNNCGAFFEIKTRFEYDVNRYTTLYGGSFTALNNRLEETNRNIYLLIVARDTGNIYISKIDKYRAKSNIFFSYFMQEPDSEILVGPSTILEYKNLYLAGKMPVLMNIIKRDFCADIFEKASKEMGMNLQLEEITV